MLFRAVMTSFVASGCVALPRTCWGIACWGGLAVDVVAPAADRHVIAAGSNSRLQRTAFVCCQVLPATSRGFASILRLVAVVASCFALASLFGPPLKRKPLGGQALVPRRTRSARRISRPVARGWIDGRARSSAEPGTCYWRSGMTA